MLRRKFSSKLCISSVGPKLCLAAKSQLGYISSLHDSNWLSVCACVCICVCACVHLRVCGSVCVLVSVCEVLNHCLLNCYRYDKTEKRRNKRFWSVTRKHRSKEVKRHTGSNFKNPVYLDQTVSVLILRGEIKNEEVCEYFFCRLFAVLARVLPL